MTPDIIDRIAVCDDGKHRDRNLPIIGITVHHFAVPGVHDAAGIARFYRANPRWTGGQMPYTFVCTPHGSIEQALPIQEVGPHALRWSEPTVSVVLIGDYSLRPPADVQWQPCVDLCAGLAAALDVADNIEGHTDRPNATRSTSKHCPGLQFDMNKFRVEVWEAMRESAIQRLANNTVIT